ncbi:uncharacterized membrane protein YgaE (UPF0421/DUF939 family) [Enterococcus rotai]|uniref:Uncharacterized protein n=2 Tax=Enterococcus TaxID=1350 RepID=A0A0U2XDN5_9ENTE|nr:DUF3958 family protein [Enterococcus rotai]ALS36913.1 hypothetical protein ATZ35_07000 [Enterococcus rotai]
MTLTSQQRFDDQNYQFRNQLEELQEAQRDNKKDQQFIEQLQERFYALQQQEQRIYQESLNEVESEERAFFEERQDDSFHLSRQALQEFEEEQEQLAQDRKTLLEKEDSVRSAHRNFLKTEEKEMSNGT